MRSASLNQDTATQLGKTHLRRGELPMALGCFQQAIELGADASVQALFIRCLFGVRFTAAVPALKPMLLRALQEIWAAPAELGRVIAPILLLEPDYHQTLAAIGRPDAFASPSFRRVAADTLLLTMLERTIITDPLLEHLLTGMRRTLLIRLREVTDEIQPYLPFCAALSSQCYASGYAYLETECEKAAVSSLANRIAAAYHAGTPVDPAMLALLACYRPLLHYPWRDELLRGTQPPTVKSMIDRHLRAPLTELELRGTIPQLTPIRDHVSKSVQTQYSENPFPEWLAPPLRAKNYDPQDWLRRSFPDAPSLPGDGKTPREILVAGCGTGQETVGLALLFANINMLAVDLSLSSLAYAKRKTDELGISGVAYAQADILELDVLNRQFDIVVCAGVLHHLSDPVEGWRVLQRLTRPGGCMMIALYSELGRREVVAAREFVAERAYGTTAEELKRFRKDVYALPAETAWRQSLLARDDFYNLSMLRDLVFHVQEHRFTIAGIAAALRNLNLRFCGFSSEPGLYPMFRQRFGTAADAFSLDLWSTFENENPGAFAGMYHFLVQKPTA